MSEKRGELSDRLLSLDGKVAMVTGGSGGIGTAVVRTFLAAGAEVASVDLPGGGHVEGASSIDCDLRDAAAVDTLFGAFGERFDGLDVLVHCAGIARDRVLWKMSAEQWSDVMRVNLDSAFHVLHRAVPLMRDRGQGSIVLIASITGERGKFGQANYAASKAGLIGLGRTAARELGRFGIRVNIVAPGLIETTMTRSLPQEVREREEEERVLDRSGRPEDVAHGVLFLSAEMSRHVSGQVLRVDGGQFIG